MHTMKLKPKAIFSNHLFGLSNFNIHEEDKTRPTLLYSKRHSRMQCTYSPQYLDVFSALLLHSICVHKENNPLTSSLHLSYSSILYKEYVQCTSRGEMGGGRLFFHVKLNLIDPCRTVRASMIVEGCQAGRLGH